MDLVNRSISSNKVVYHPRLKKIMKKWLNFTAKELETDDEVEESLMYLKVRVICYLFV